MDGVFLLVIVIVTFALIFDYINGFHDAANSVATIVATRVLTPPPQWSLPETQVFGRFAVGARELIVPLETRESSLFVLEEAAQPGAKK